MMKDFLKICLKNYNFIVYEYFVTYDYLAVSQPFYQFCDSLM